MPEKKIKSLVAGSDFEDLTFNNICVDSRLVNPGDLFVALPGNQTDGHHFIPQAKASGAVAAVVCNSYKVSGCDLPLIAVPDTLQFLQDAARKRVKESQSKVVAVTGSVGKTTTKDFITHLISQKYRVASTPGNNNSQIGLPLALLNHFDGTEDIVVLEMGMTLPGQIAGLVSIAPPDIAVITSIALVHAAFFSSLEEIAKEKFDLLSHPKTQLGIVSDEILHLCKALSHELPAILTYSITNPKAHYFFACNKDALWLREPFRNSLSLPLLTLPGKHNLQNFLAAVAVSRELGLTKEEIVNGMQTLKLPQKRLEIVQKYGMTFINDAYNASEISVKAALETLPDISMGARKIAVLGEMLELGVFSDSCHRRVGLHALNYADHMLCLGERTRPIVDVWKEAGRPVTYCADRAEVVKELQHVVKPGDVILLKGSRLKEMWKIIDEIGMIQ